MREIPTNIRNIDRSHSYIPSKMDNMIFSTLKREMERSLLNLSRQIRVAT
jgi:hypothetical protein